MTSVTNNVPVTPSTTSFQSGVSEHPDGVIAAREAVSAALHGRVPASQDLIVLFSSTIYDTHAVHESALLAAHGVPLVGCSVSSGGSFAETGSARPGISATHIPAGDTVFGIGSVSDLGSNLADGARRASVIARERAGEVHPHSALMLLSDGLAGDLREIVRGAHQATGPSVPTIGGAAGDLDFSGTYQFAEGNTYTNGLVAIWINSPTPIGVAVRHGWREVGAPMLVTRAEGNIIYELDGLPALQTFLDQHQLLRGEAAHASLTNHGPIAQQTLGLELFDTPLGIASLSGRYDVRHISGVAADGTSLCMFGSVPEHAVVQLMTSDSDDLLEGARAASIEAASQLDGDARGVLVFSCVARSLLLGARLPEEHLGISQVLGGAPSCGFYTFSEYARVSGSTGFHNASVAVLAL